MRYQCIMHCLISFAWQVSYGRWQVSYGIPEMVYNFETCSNLSWANEMSPHRDSNTRITYLLKEIYIWVIKIRWKKTEDQTFVHGRYTLHWIYGSIFGLLLCKPALLHYDMCLLIVVFLWLLTWNLCLGFFFLFLIMKIDMVNLQIQAHGLDLVYILILF